MSFNFCQKPQYLSLHFIKSRIITLKFEITIIAKPYHYEKEFT